MENDWCIDCRLTLIPATGLWGKITPSTVFAKNSDTCDCDSSLRERLDVRYKPSNNNNNTSKWNESRKLFLDIVTDPPGLSTTVERMSISASFLSGHDRKSWRRFVHFADFESIPTWHCISGTECGIVEIPTATPHLQIFQTIATGFDCPTSGDNCRQSKIAMRPVNRK